MEYYATIKWKTHTILYELMWINFQDTLVHKKSKVQEYLQYAILCVQGSWENKNIYIHVRVSAHLSSKKHKKDKTETNEIGYLPGSRLKKRGVGHFSEYAVPYTIKFWGHVNHTHTHTQ